VEVVLPAGSYVKAKLLTGVEAPEGRTYPVLLQLDYAHIVPNNKSVDLKGCFVIAKAEGDLSTERVQMQATKLSCVARNGQMFEREINGFVADARDNSFSVTGTVNSKQDRVAAMAFLAAVVEGIGRSVQMAQTSTQTFSSGAQSQVLTGNEGRYLAAGGAASAAGQVTQWYLKEAQNLLPTINVGSGQDVWVVLNDTIELPHTYFRMTFAGGSHGKDYQFTNRLLD
jgi:conjugal transfer pilus assembly protein TraB